MRPPWMLVREEYCIIPEKHVNKLVLLRRNAWSWSILMSHKQLESSHSYSCSCNTSFKSGIHVDSMLGFF